MKKVKTVISILIALIVILLVILGVNHSNRTELQSIKTKQQLKQMYEGKPISMGKEIGMGILTMPYSAFADYWSYMNYSRKSNTYLDSMTQSGVITPDSMATNIQESATLDFETSSQSSNKDYSTTNIQVENVDEADITKTDGDYIYSISESKVLITDVRKPQNIVIVATIEAGNSSTVVPEELILYQNKLVVIYAETSNNSSYYSNQNNTIVKIYDIQNKEAPNLVKEYTLYEPYYTSRCIGNKLYVISSGSLRKEKEDIVTDYREDNQQKQIELRNIQYLKGMNTNYQTLISMTNLDTPKEEVSLHSYLMNIENAYISENNIYLLNQSYESGEMKISSIFGLRGILGAFDEEIYENGYYGTDIYKFKILEDGRIQYDTKTRQKGRTMNQFSLDEYEGKLRVALYDNDGSRVVVLDEKLQKIGETEPLAKGENMYSSRFMGQKAYLVTYRTVDPLYVIDLSDATNPKVLGELKIPGYSTYLHPYDENHIIGIGMQTEEVVNRSSTGRVLSTTARVVGMKMALFDVSDVNHPVQMSETVIGDSRTSSAILTNHKALLFSKEKELIAIPVNNYSEDFRIETTSEDQANLVSLYKNYNKEYIGEGYFVYHINVTDGLTLKGVINHEKTKRKYSYYNQSKLLRGMYIEDNLYTVSESAIKVNRLDNLALVSELKITE